MGDVDEMTAWLRKEIEGDLGIARHILDVRGARPDARREMHDAIADGEAKLAILDLYAATLALVEKPAPAAQTHPEAVREHARLYGIPEETAAATLISARDYLDAKRELAVLGPVVRLLATGYRHREGYREEWAP
jgi:hypothetical protein